MYNQPSHEMKCKSQFGKRLNNKHVKILCDNSPINAMGGTKSPSCNQVAYDIRDWCVNNNTWLTATHIAGVENTEADEESWLFSDHTEWALKREIFPQITTYWGIPEIYLFVSWLNTQLPRFVSWKCDPASCFVDAFIIRWDSLYIYAFPPFCQINRCLKKNLEEQVPQGIMILPLWSTQVWWPQLLRMIIAIPFVLPKHQDLLSLSHSPQKFHPLGKKLTMLAFLLSGGSGDFTSSYKAHHGYMAKWNKEKIQYIHKKMAKLLYSEANQSYSTTCSTCAWLSHSTISTRPYIQCRQRCQKYLSSYVTSEDGTCVGKHPPVSRLMIGVFQEKPPRPKYTEIWDVSIVLVYLQSLSPVNTLLLKELALKLVVLIFFSLRQKRSDCTFVEYWPHGFFK